MAQFELTEITRTRIAKWVESTKPVSLQPTWTERRLAIVFGGHTYIVANGQVYVCAHCGHYDPEWKATEVLAYFKVNFNIDPIEIDVTCSVAVTTNEES